MRLVSHPNVVDLKAFFYSNGEKASKIVAFPIRFRDVSHSDFRRTKCT